MGRRKSQSSRRPFLSENQGDQSSLGFSTSESIEDSLFDSLTFTNSHLENQKQTLYFRGGSFATAASSHIASSSKFLRHGRIYKSKAFTRHFDIQTTTYSASTSSSFALSKRRKFGKCHHRCEGDNFFTNASSSMALVHNDHLERSIGVRAKSFAPIYALIDGKFRLLNGYNIADVLDNLASSTSRRIKQFSICDETTEDNEPFDVSLGNHSSQFTTSKASLNLYTVDDLSHLLSTATNFSSTSFSPHRRSTFSVVTFKDKLPRSLNGSHSRMPTVRESTTTVTTVNDADDDSSSATISATVRPFERAFAALTVADAKCIVTQAQNSLVSNSNVSSLNNMLNNFQDLSIGGGGILSSQRSSANSFHDATQRDLMFAYQEDLCKRFSTLPISNKNELGSDLQEGIIPPPASPAFAYHSD